MPQGRDESTHLFIFNCVTNMTDKKEIYIKHFSFMLEIFFTKSYSRFEFSLINI